RGASAGAGRRMLGHGHPSLRKRRCDLGLPAMRRSADAPILVLGSGQRCGSTLIQRLLTSHRGVMIWGEHGGRLRELIKLTEILAGRDPYVSAPARQAFEAGGHATWMANVMPGPAPVAAAARAYLV